MFDIHQYRPDQDGNWDEETVDNYCQELMAQFDDSPEGSATFERYADLGWALLFLEYGFRYLNVAPPEMSRRDVEEILFEIFPRKVSTSADSADAIVGEVRGLWEHLQRQYQLPNSTDIIDFLGDEATETLRRELANPENFGMAKSMVMMGREAGFDMTTQEGLTKFMITYNSFIAHRMDEAEELGAPKAKPKSKSKSQELVGRSLTVDERKSRKKLLRDKLAKSKRKHRKK